MTLWDIYQQLEKELGKKNIYLNNVTRIALKQVKKKYNFKKYEEIINNFISEVDENLLKPKKIFFKKDAVISDINTKLNKIIMLSLIKSGEKLLENKFITYNKKFKGKRTSTVVPELCFQVLQLFPGKSISEKIYNVTKNACLSKIDIKPSIITITNSTYEKLKEISKKYKLGTPKLLATIPIYFLYKSVKLCQ